MSSPEQRLARAFKHRRRWELEARAAVLDAKAAGMSYADIARAAGITRQGARKLLTERNEP
jgi:predicted transcriptional regulator